MKTIEEKQLELKITANHIRSTLDDLGELLVRKNEYYGDSLNDSTFIFSSEHNKTNLSLRQFGMCVRIDDKLKRIKNSGLTEHTLDSLDDVIGYLVRLKMTFEE